MRCPICNGEMEKGYVQFHRGMAWAKNKHKISLSPKEGELFIYNMNSMKYICLKRFLRSSGLELLFLQNTRRGSI